MPLSNVEGPPTVKGALARDPEMQKVSRRLASLALAHVEQEGRLRVRQREQLRRALATAGETLCWTEVAIGAGDSVDDMTSDVMKLAKSGARALARELAKELADKRTEMARLGKIADATRKMAENAKTSYPTDVTFSVTARNASQELVTKTETLTANDADEAIGIAETIEKKIAARAKLTDMMIVELEEKQTQLNTMKRTIPEFVKGSKGLLREVMITLQ